jgi:YegS/Rv2252/BmrU family lipid kinase
MPIQRVAFVINPKSGKKSNTDRVAFIRGLLGNGYESTIYEWNKIEDRDAIFSEVLAGKYEVAFAAGGDGTVNQLGHALCGSETALGILPFGSGNGLARHLGVPIKTADALQLIGTGKIAWIDRGVMNGQSFFCTAGVGFDALIGKLFAESTERGFSTYSKMTVREFRNYAPETYRITVDGKTIDREAFLVTAANAGQYGNNAWIAPEATINDGLLHLSVLRPFPWYTMPGLGIRMFLKTLRDGRYFESFSGKTITIERKTNGPAHFDGEPVMLENVLHIRVEPAALRVLVPAGFKG